MPGDRNRGQESSSVSAYRGEVSTEIGVPEGMRYWFGGR
jgi:hypothetical protein